MIHPILMDLSFFPPPPTEHGAKGPWIEAAKSTTSAAFKKERRTSAILAWLRFFTFAVMAVGIYGWMAEGLQWSLFVGLGGLLAFVAAVRLHGRVRFRVQTLALLGAVLDESRRRVDGDPLILRDGDTPNDGDFWDSLYDSHACYTLSPQELGDLDVFGRPISLFGLLNRTSSPAGAARLAQCLSQPLADAAKILERQEAARWLDGHPIQRLRLMAAAAGFRSLSKEFRQMFETIRDAQPMPGGAKIRIARLWGLAGPIAVALGLGELIGWCPIPFGWLPIIVVAMINGIVLSSIRENTGERIRPWLDLEDVVAQFQFFAASAVESLPQDGALGRRRQQLEAVIAPGILPRLEARIPYLFLGFSGIVHAIIDLLVLWDLQAVAMIEAVAVRHQTELLRAIEAIGEIEFLASLGTYAWEEDGAIFPVVETGKPRLEIESGRHPLIARAEAVANSLTLSDPARTWVITGSNMSGKSTFLRMTATNSLLAMIGSAVPAKSMRITPMEILTDLRIRDDLSRKESYFLAEVRQVRRMVEAARRGRNVFVLIDEPFRGTNSAERVAAASAVVRTLINGSGLHLVATHDAALTTLGDLPNAKNQHFEERFENEGLVFDYLLRDGPARSRNALLVLESEGYPADLVTDAKRIANELGNASA
ncbi:MAG: hypothetical protein H6818_21600 [Phycisphaerales bacterium]|nr:hypothetical protein [Phycisphaerales bacterium]MCB9862386.1 hypothetical protein [Phycisphaerales bacterium]